MYRDVKLDQEKGKKVYRSYFGIYLELRAVLIAAGLIYTAYCAVMGDANLYMALIITGVVAAVMLGDIRCLKNLFLVKKEIKAGVCKQAQIKIQDIQLNTQSSLYSIGGALEGKFKCKLMDDKGGQYLMCVGRVSDLTHILNLVKGRHIVIDYLPKSRLLAAIHVVPAFENEGEQSSFEFQLKKMLDHYVA